MFHDMYGFVLLIDEYYSVVTLSSRLRLILPPVIHMVSHCSNFLYDVWYVCYFLVLQN